MRFKNLEGKPERKSPKRTVSANSGLGSLQMVLELDARLCTSEEAEPRREVDTTQCVSNDTEP